MEAISFDPIWEEKYKAGHQQRAPWDEVVSFIFRNRPKNKSHGETSILEVGCGTASNLWFFAMEGFEVHGIDASSSAISHARERFKKDNLKSDLRIGDFTQLPYQDSSFDLVIDRAALSCCGTSAMKKALSEITRVLKPGGKFLFTPYADKSSSFRSGERGRDDVILDVCGGIFGQLRFLSFAEIAEFLPRKDWDIESVHLVEITDMLNKSIENVAAQWRVSAARR